MNEERKTIPGLEVEYIGKKDPIKFISGVLHWPCWNGYLEEDVGFSKREKRLFTGEIGLTVDGGVNADGSLNISPGQVHAYWFLVDQPQKMKDVVLNGLVQDFPRLLEEEYMYYDIEEGGFPPLSQIVPGYDFKEYISLDAVRILGMEKEDSAYVHWLFSCSWDIEHGFIMVTHKDRVIEIGQDDDPWKLYKDNGTYEQEMAAFQSLTFPAPYSWKKKWWQFWKKY